jgi:hypothetical protein
MASFVSVWFLTLTVGAILGLQGLVRRIGLVAKQNVNARKRVDEPVLIPDPKEDIE